MDHLVKKVDEMLISMDIIDGNNGHVETSCEHVFKSVDNVKSKINLVEQLLEKYAGDLEHQKDLEKQFEDLKDVLLYIQRYFPAGVVAVTDEEQEEVLVDIQSDKKMQSTIATPRKALPVLSNGLATNSSQYSLNVPKIIFQSCESSGSSVEEQKMKTSPNTGQENLICLISNEEFDQVPSYMKGRLTVSNINEFIDIFNATLSKKYQLLKKPKKSKTKAELEHCYVWKQQESGELVGSSFLTADDFDKLSQIKLGNKKFINIITILRHLKRMKEVRNLKVIYYIALL